MIDGLKQFNNGQRATTMATGQPIPWTTQEILEATQGELLCGDVGRRFVSVSIDSRKIAATELFVAIIGDIHDGHAFAGDVVDKGIQGLIVNHDSSRDLPLTGWNKNGIACIAVEDTTRALGALAAFNRQRAAVSVVAITGSNGKTTTRKLTAAVVAQQFNTLATSGNLNNQIGMPLTLLKLQPGHKWAILELGTNHPGEIEYLAEICLPDIGVITNVGPAHLEGLGSLEGVMLAKGELLGKLKQEGKAVLNADDPMVLQLARKTDKEVIFFGLSAEADIRARAIEDTAVGISFTLGLPSGEIKIELRMPGRFMVMNALAAAAVGYAGGLAPADIKAGLEVFQPEPGRMNIIKTNSGITIIDDTYNANPASMEASIAALDSLRAGSRSVLVVGDMRELGPQAESLHEKTGGIAAQSGIGKLYAVGEFAKSYAAGAFRAKMSPADMFIGSRSEIIADLKIWLQPGDWILVKGSRSMGMEKITRDLKEWAEEKSS